MFNYHSLIPWGLFRGCQEEKWGSFQGWDHFGVDLGIISGLGVISGSGSFRGLYSSRYNYNGLHWDVPPERATFFGLQVYQRVSISQG